MSVTTQSKPTVKIARPFNSDEIEQRVVSILRSGMLVQGQFVKQFESKLAQYIGCKHVIAVNSGTAALHASLLSLKNRHAEKNEVITTPVSFAATANAVIHAGCKPRFVDVDGATFNIDPDLVDHAVSDKTLAIEPVDVYGLPADLEKITKIANSRKIPIVEDAAESIGASYRGKKIGNISTLSGFSTYATKNLHTGEGGFVTTNDDSLAEEIRMIRNQGQASRYNQKVLGYNFRMLEFCAAIGLSQIPILDEMNAKRREHAKRLKDLLTDVDCLSFQKVDNPNEHAWYMFALTLDENEAGISRDKLVSKLRENGVEADVSWPMPIHLQPYFKETLGFKEGDFPKAEKICRSIFQLPIQPFLKEEEIDRVAEILKQAVC